MALVRLDSISKPANLALKSRGIEPRPLDTRGSQESIISALQGPDLLISAIAPMELLEQVPLATAAKIAGVKRFFPCAFSTAMPMGIQVLRDLKEDVFNHVERIGLSYTIVDVGWLYQGVFHAIPSGKIDYAVVFPGQMIPGDGNIKSGLTYLADIGRYVARIIHDERTVNKMVFVYTELWTPNEFYDLLERLSGEFLHREYASFEQLQAQIVEAEAKMPADPGNFLLRLQQIEAQYQISWGIRGDNTPEYAKFLGYLNGKELYLDLKFTNFKDYLGEVLAGRAKPVYDELKTMFQNLARKA